jgi:hypothetical protein
MYYIDVAPKKETMWEGVCSIKKGDTERSEKSTGSD